MTEEEKNSTPINLGPQPSNAELKSLLEKNLAVSQEILDISTYIKGYVFWRKIIGFIQLVVIVVPIVLVIIYLPPFLEDLMDKLPSVVNTSSFNLNN
ncbi:MAG: hypothetical protein K9M44_00890 [Candidatus Pacebacteria bacterium]|nr:hypothetical protein [Candidatus Paceibacterota bacterium]